MKVKDLIWMIAFGGAALFAYDRTKSDPADAMPLKVARTNPVVPVATVEDRSWIKPRDSQPGSAAPSASNCDGRSRCPQMTSCAEANYFIQHCPDTQMDGDGDGNPCEDQWCR